MGDRTREERGGLDELLKPTLAGEQQRVDPHRLPWRLGSQVYVAFFGGALAVTAIAILNARRLRMPDRTAWAMAAVGVIGLAGAVAAAAAFGGTGGSSARIPARVVALATYGVLYLMQRRADRVHHYHARGDDPYDSLWGPGLIACFTVGIVEAILIFSFGGDA